MNYMMFSALLTYIKNWNDSETRITQNLPNTVLDLCKLTKGYFTK